MNWLFRRRQTAALLRSAKTDYPAPDQLVARAVASVTEAPAPSLTSSPLRLLAYVGACLLLLSLLGLRVNRSVQGHRARSLLIAAAEAAEAPTTCHIVQMMSGPEYPPRPLASMESWQSPEGWRTDQYRADGTLQFSAGWEAGNGRLWLYEPDQRAMVVAQCKEYGGTSPAEKANEMHSDRVTEELSHAQEVATRQEGSMSIVSVRPVPLPDMSGPAFSPHDRDQFQKVVRSREYLVDDATGRLLGIRTYDDGPQGRWEVSDLRLEYNLPIAPNVIAFTPPPGTHVYELAGPLTEWNDLVSRRPWAPGKPIK